MAPRRTDERQDAAWPNRVMKEAGAFLLGHVPATQRRGAALGLDGLLQGRADKPDDDSGPHVDLGPFRRLHGSGTGRAERHHVRPAEAAFRAHLRKPQETFGKSVVNV